VPCAVFIGRDRKITNAADDDDEKKKNRNSSLSSIADINYIGQAMSADHIASCEE